MNNVFSPFSTFANICQLDFFPAFPFRYIHRIHALQWESSGHQPVGHILFQHFINRPFDFQFLLHCRLSPRFLPLTFAAAAAAAAGWSTAVFEIMKFEWRRQFAPAIFLPFVSFESYMCIDCNKFVSISTSFERSWLLCDDSFLFSYIFFLTSFDSYSLFIEQYEIDLNRMLDSERHRSEQRPESNRIKKTMASVCVLSEKSWHSKWMHFNKLAPDQSAATGAVQIK